MFRAFFWTACLITAVSMPAAVQAEDGTLNPEELSLNSAIAKAVRGEVDMMTCAQGYFITKSGRHAEARSVFERCAEAGYTGAMTWMAQMEDNGLGGPENPEAAAAWDLRAADAGDPVGQFNYGLDLLRGHGVTQDIELGRRYVNRAAEAGLPVAQRLRAAEYDLDEVTPDADNWKYQRIF